MTRILRMVADLEIVRFGTAKIIAQGFISGLRNLVDHSSTNLKLELSGLRYQDGAW